MKDYIDTFKAVLDRRNIRYTNKDRIVMFSRRYSDAKADVRMRFIFVLFPEAIDIGVVMMQPLGPEQVILTRPLLKDINEDLVHGAIESGAPSDCIRFSGSFDGLLPDECHDWCPEMHEHLLEFIVDYTTDIVVNAMLHVFDKVTDEKLASAITARPRPGMQT